MISARKDKTTAYLAEWATGFRLAKLSVDEEKVAPEPKYPGARSIYPHSRFLDDLAPLDELILDECPELLRRRGHDFEALVGQT